MGFHDLDKLNALSHITCKSLFFLAGRHYSPQIVFLQPLSWIPTAAHAWT